ncbi:MAG: copper resistance protein B [Rhodospirillaceae bacterium]
MRTIAFIAALTVAHAASAQDHDHSAAPAAKSAQAAPAHDHADHAKPAAKSPAVTDQHDHADHSAAPAAAAQSKGRILYYKNPMGEPDTSPVPKKDSMGMDYIPVYESDAPAPQDKGRVLYYKNPMGEPDTSPVPKKDSMGMDYIPVYESDVPPTITDHAADKFYDRNVMADARALLKQEHGGAPVSLFSLNIFELQARKGNEGYRWEGEAWYGGDSHRAVVKFKGEGEFQGNLGEAEVQALYAKPIGPYFNLQAGLRYDIEPNPSRGYGVIGVEGLAPYWFEVGGSLFVSNKGDVHARVEGYYDLNVTQRLVLQPRAEIDIAAQDVPELNTGAGISNVEAELRLRYEIRREFAPYIGVSFERKVGQTADLARAAGEHVSSTSFVAGVRLFF